MASRTVNLGFRTLPGSSGEKRIAKACALIAVVAMACGTNSEDPEGGSGSPPTVSVQATDDAAEPDVNGRFTLALSEPAATDVEVLLAASGTAAAGTEAGADYRPLAGSVVIPAGESSVTVEVETIDDDDIESAETVTLAIEGLANEVEAGVGDDAEASIAIADDDGDFGLRVVTGLGPADGIATGGIYGAGQVGAATLDVMANNDNVRSSNFGAGSFKLTNTGDKRIAAIFIDFREALFGDSVVDFDGSAGDTAAKRFRVDGDDTTGAFFAAGDEQTYFLLGDPPFPDTTGSNNPVSGGFRGLLLLFGTADGGHEPGETAAFSGDMDPNSIAGLAKGRVDRDAVEGWDVGGVSGAEVVGSRFFVLFDDGATALGFLGSSGTQAGAIGLAVEGQEPVVAHVSVNGGATIYGGEEPVIDVQGSPGQRVQIVLAKGLQPVTNDEPVDGGDTGPRTLVEQRLALSEPAFPVNNAFDIQTVEVTVDASGRARVPAGALLYSATVSGIEFPGADTAPIAVAAVAIGLADRALGPVSRVYLSNPTQTPVP